MALEVGSLLVHLLVALRCQAGMSNAELLRGLRFRAEDLADPHSRVDWEDFTVLLDRTLDDAGGDEAFEALMADSLRLAIPAEVCLGLFHDLQTFYVWLATVTARSLHTNLQTTARADSSGRILMEHHIPRPYRCCRALALASAGAFRGATRILGLPDAAIELAFDERCGLYQITLPALSGGLHPLRAPAQAAVSMPTRTLYQPAEFPHIRLFLRRGIELLESSSLPDLLARLEEDLRVFGGCTAGNIWLRSGDGSMALVHTWGAPADFLCTRMLAMGTRVLGRVDLAESHATDPREQAAIQEFLGWASPAIDRWLTEPPEGERSRALAWSLQLTAREREVLALLAQGLSDKEIAHLLGTSPRTVSHQVGGLLRKGRVENRTALAWLCLGMGAEPHPD